MAGRGDSLIAGSVSHRIATHGSRSRLEWTGGVLGGDEGAQAGESLPWAIEGDWAFFACLDGSVSVWMRGGFRAAGAGGWAMEEWGVGPLGGGVRALVCGARRLGEEGLEEAGGRAGAPCLVIGGEDGSVRLWRRRVVGRVSTPLSSRFPSVPPRRCAGPLHS